MRRLTWLAIATATLASAAGCRQLFGIDDTRVNADAGPTAIDAPAATIDAPPGQPDAPPPATDAPPGDARACATTYPMTFGGHRYEVSGGQTSWSPALGVCNAAGGYLAIPDDLTEDTWMAQLNQGNLWIGVSDLVTEGQFVTVKNETIPPHYQRFVAGEPSGGIDQNCVQILTSSGSNDGFWDDTGCNNTRRYLCECDP
jgi:hypothetical protein